MTEPVGPDRVRLQKDAPWSTDIGRDELLDLHRILIEEYRFQIKLNADRTQAYLILNAAILTAGTGLLKIGVANATPLVTAILFLGAVVAWIAARATKKGHDYYRAIVYKKTLVEHLLGRHQRIDGYSYRGATLAIETTPGMSSEQKILDDAEAWLARPLRAATITGGLVRIFRLISVLDIFGALYTGALTMIDSHRLW